MIDGTRTEPAGGAVGAGVGVGCGRRDGGWSRGAHGCRRRCRAAGGWVGRIRSADRRRGRGWRRSRVGVRMAPVTEDVRARRLDRGDEQGVDRDERMIAGAGERDGQVMRAGGGVGRVEDLARMKRARVGRHGVALAVDGDDQLAAGAPRGPDDLELGAVVGQGHRGPGLAGCPLGAAEGRGRADGLPAAAPVERRARVLKDGVTRHRGRERVARTIELADQAGAAGNRQGEDQQQGEWGGSLMSAGELPANGRVRVGLRCRARTVHVVRQWSLLFSTG